MKAVTHLNNPRRVALHELQGAEAMISVIAKLVLQVSEADDEVLGKPTCKGLKL